MTVRCQCVCVFAAAINVLKHALGARGSARDDVGRPQPA